MKSNMRGQKVNKVGIHYLFMYSYVICILTYIGVHFQFVSPVVTTLSFTKVHHMAQFIISWLATTEFQTTHQHGQRVIGSLAGVVVVVPTSAIRGQMLLEQMEAWVT